MSWNKAIGSPIPAKHYDNIAMCYSKAVTEGDLPMAITTNSDRLDLKAWESAMDAYQAAGSHGLPPDRSAYRLERVDKPNTMDLCTWYLDEMKVGGFAMVDKSTIEKVQKPDFIAVLKGDDKAIDALSTTLGGTMLHEVRPTNPN